MEHIWTIVCQITSEDKNTSALSLINVLENISFSADIPESEADDVVIPLNFHLVTTWCREETDSSDENEVKVRLMSPTGEDLGGPDLKISFNESQNTRYNVNFQGFPYKGDGIYRYVLFNVKDGENVEVQRIPILVERTPFIEQQDAPVD